MTCVPEIHSVSWNEKMDKRNILKSFRLSIYSVVGSPLPKLLLTDVCQINFLMLDFLLQLKSIYFILASAYKKSLFLLSLKYFKTVFMSPFRLPLVQDNPSSFLLGHIFLCIAFLLHSQFFLKLDAILQCWAEQEGCFTCLTGDIFVCMHQCHICLFNSSITLLIHVQFVVHRNSQITFFVSPAVLRPVFEQIVIVTYVNIFHSFLSNWASFLQVTSLICHNFSDSCSILQCVYRLPAWVWFYL